MLSEINKTNTFETNGKSQLIKNYFHEYGHDKILCFPEICLQNIRLIDSWSLNLNRLLPTSSAVSWLFTYRETCVNSPKSLCSNRNPITSTAQTHSNTHIRTQDAKHSSLFHVTSRVWVNRGCTCGLARLPVRTTQGGRTNERKIYP